MSPTHLKVAQVPAARPQGIEVARAVREVEPYKAVSSLDEIQQRPTQVPHKLDWNEATVPPSPRVLEAIAAFLGNAHHLNWYPVLNSTNLIERLAAFYKVPGDRLLITNGSDDALDTVCKTYLDPGDPVLVASPTYQHFLVFAQARGAEIIHHYAPDPFSKDVAGLKLALEQIQPRVFYLVNPNNPTGVLYDADEVATLLAAAPRTLFIVDEAYSEFAGRTALHLLETYSNLVVTRTFSKAYALAGLRIGYCFGHEQTINDLRRVFNPKSVNVLGQIAAMAALEDQDYLNTYVAEVDASKRLMAQWFESRGFPFRWTPANYVMVKFDRAPWVTRLLREAGVYVRDRSQISSLNGYVRFSVGTLEQTHDVLNRLETVLDKLREI